MASLIHTNGLRTFGLVVATVAAVVGCGGGVGGGPTASGPGGGNGEICAAAQKEPIKPGAQLVVVVVDRTASARTGLSDPPDLDAVIAGAQAKGVEDKTGSQIQTLGVTASGQFPSIGKPTSLDLRPGDTSKNANDLRQRILHDCVPGLLRSDNTQANGDNTDLLGALLAAQQQKPAQIVVISSGLNSTSQASLDPPPAEPAQLAEAVKQAIPAFASWSTPVTWFNLGEPNPPLSAPDRDRVIAFWQALLGDQLNSNTREGAPAK